MAYVDGFVVPVPKDRLDAYVALARTSAAVWKEHGALAYMEAVADDVSYGRLTSFPRAVMAPESGEEVVIFAFITYRDRAHRDEVNAKVFADPRMAGMEPGTAPFDTRRMIWGGFSALVEA
jgi:uncharacterized protein YbaA (DUF1428 family)